MADVKALLSQLAEQQAQLVEYQALIATQEAQIAAYQVTVSTQRQEIQDLLDDTISRIVSEDQPSQAHEPYSVRL